MARFTAREIQGLVGGTMIGNGEAVVDAITTDSRNASSGAMFVALDGLRTRGVTHVPEAFGSGCSVVLVPRDWEGTPPEGRAAIAHDSPLDALAILARAVRNDWDVPVAAVTGSVGKTTTKEMIAHASADLGFVFRSPGNFNTVEGLSRAILELDRKPDAAILEAGASELGEIAKIARLVQPVAAAVTNVSAAHLEGFESLEGIAREKTDLLRAVPEDGLRLVDGDDEIVLAAARDLEVTRVGFSDRNDWRAEDIRPTERGSAFRVPGVGEVELRVPGQHQVKNALFAVAIAEALGVQPARAFECLGSFSGVAGRLTLLEARGIVVADDTYNANPASMNAALDWLVSGEKKGRLGVVLGDMLEMGEDSKDLHAELGRRVASLDVDWICFVGEESRAAFEEGRGGGDSRFHYAETSKKAARLSLDWAEPGDTILVKGSRGMRMEVVVQALVGEERHAL